MTTALSGVFGVEAKMQERIVVLACNENHIAAVAPIAATRAAAGNIFLAAECEATVPAVTGFDGDNYLIDEHR
jgi:hypothetical protein